MPIGVLLWVLSSYGISFNQVEYISSNQVGYFLTIYYPEKSSSLEEGKKQKNNPEKIWWFQNNDVLLHPKSSIKSCPVAAHQPSFA